MFCVIAKRGPDGRFLPGTRIGDEEISRERILNFAAFVAKRLQTEAIAAQTEQPATEKENLCMEKYELDVPATLEAQELRGMERRTDARLDRVKAAECRQNMIPNKHELVQEALALLESASEEDVYQTVKFLTLIQR